MTAILFIMILFTFGNDASFAISLGVLDLPPLQCRPSAFVQELLAEQDAFRAVSILKETEFTLRQTDPIQGLGCSRLLLGIFLTHQEFDAADAQLNALLAHYKPFFSDPQQTALLRAQMAYLFGNPLEVKNRLQPTLPTGAFTTQSSELLTFSALKSHPFESLDSPSVPPCLTAPCQELQTIVTSQQAMLKSETLGLALSLLPGFGQIYAGRTLSGIASFVLNSVLFGITAYAYSRNERAFAYLSTVGTAGIYLGNLYAGYETTRRANEDITRQTQTAIQKIAITPELSALGIGSSF
jgi:TM2 domain-containing membrane protein YozV